MTRSLEVERDIAAEKQEREAVLGLFSSLLRPLVQVAFEYSLSAREITDAVRRIYLQGLEQRLSAQKRPTTDARLALLAGLNRSEVSALRRNGTFASGKDANAAATMDQIASILTAWHTHARFSGAYGLALDLDLAQSASSPRASFQELVQTICPTVDWESVLDELVASGSIEIVDQKIVRCRSRAYVLPSGNVTVIERAARFLEAVTATLTHNLLKQGIPPYFERTVVSDSPLSDQGRDEFLKLSFQRGQEFLAELDTSLAKIAEQMSSTSGKQYGVGVYFFEEQASTAQSSRRMSNLETKPIPTREIEEIDVLAPQNRKK